MPYLHAAMVTSTRVHFASGWWAENASSFVMMMMMIQMLFLHGDAELPRVVHTSGDVFAVSRCADMLRITGVTRVGIRELRKGAPTGGNGKLPTGELLSVHVDRYLSMDLCTQR
jgi:hypothetical protein